MTVSRAAVAATVRFLFGLSAVLFLLLGASSAGAAPAGPLNLGDPSLPLLSETLHVEIDSQAVDATLRRQYHNRSGARTEGTFRFRGSEDVHVDGFSYWNGEQKIVGEVFEKAVAQQIYQETVSGRRDPGLLTKDGEAAFSFRVFPIELDEKKRIEVEFEQWLPRRGQTLEFRQPLDSPNAEIDVVIQDQRGVGKISSPTHHIRVSGGGARVRVHSREARRGGKEFVLRWEPRDRPWQMQAFLHRDKGHDAYVLLSLPTPPSATKPMAKDVTLAIDCSGSMAGEPLTNAKAAAADVVRHLSDRDRVNVILFDDTVEALFDHPQPVAKAREQAVEFIERALDSGGTDIAAALARAFDAQGDNRRPKTILFLTDGKSDPQEALEVAKAERRDVRVFTVGLGEGVDRPLLSHLASTKRGRFMFIENARSIESKVSALYGQIADPRMVDVRLKVEGGRFDRIYPRTLPDLFDRDELVVVGRLRGSGRATFTLEGTTRQGTKRISKTVDIPRANRRSWVGSMWGRGRIAHLLEQMALRGEREELKNETINLALAYNVVTPYTAFLAIPESELTSRTAQTLAAARERKREIFARHRDAGALTSKDSTSVRISSGTMFAEEAADLDDAPLRSDSADASGPTSAEMGRSRRGIRHKTGATGCASCRSTGPDAPPALALLGLLFLLMRSRRSYKSVSDRR